MKKTSLFKVIAVAILVFSGSCQTASTFDLTRALDAGMKGVQAMTLSNAQVAEYVSQAVQQMDAQNTVAVANSPYTQRLKRLTSGIHSVGSTPLNFKVYMTSDVNAFACADGSVRVYSGLMDMMTDDELLGIIGHEIGHVGMEHSKNAMKQELLNAAILEGAGAVSSKVARLTDSQLTAIGSAMMSARYSRKQENQADDYGYDFLKKSGKNPYNMILAFEKMQQLENRAGANSAVGSYFAKMFSDHPETSKRIQRIQKYCKRDGFQRPANK